MAPSKKYGSRREVKAGVALMTTGGLKKRDIIHRKDGRYVSRVKAQAARQNPDLAAWRRRVTVVVHKHPGWSVGDAIAHIKKSRSRSRSR